jgi:hypothetical protein
VRQLVAHLSGLPALNADQRYRAVAAAVGSFSVTSGPCTVDSSGTCFFSPNYPSTYDLYDSCTISVLEAVTLSVVAFDLYTFDYLYVGWNDYSGTDGPDGEQVNSILGISFTSSGYGTSSGFKICSGSTGASQPGRGLSLPRHGAAHLSCSPSADALDVGDEHAGSASPTATNTIEMNSAYQACLTSPSTCTYLCVPSPSVAVPSRMRVARVQLSSHEAAVTASV